MSRIATCEHLKARSVESTTGITVARTSDTISSAQFHRIADCSMGNLPSESIHQRKYELAAKNLLEPIAPHANMQIHQLHQANSTFGVIAAPTEKRYRKFGAAQ